ncbi:MAG: hypothetical protein U0X91_30775 [Spirosomataceae bacterium]
MPFKYCKAFRSYVGVWVIILGYFDAIGQGAKVIEKAQKDVGTLEKTRNNDHALFDYYRANVSPALNKWKAPYCGCALYTWFLEAGYKPKVAAPATALSWQRKQGVILGRNTTAAHVQKLAPGMVVLMKFSRYHVGVLKKPYPGYMVTIEGNTSNAKAVNFTPGKQDGVFEKIRPYSVAIGAYDWLHDADRYDTTQTFNLRKKFVKPQTFK